MSRRIQERIREREGREKKKEKERHPRSYLSANTLSIEDLRTLWQLHFNVQVVVDAVGQSPNAHRHSHVWKLQSRVKDRRTRDLRLKHASGADDTLGWEFWHVGVVQSVDESVVHLSDLHSRLRLDGDPRVGVVPLVEHAHLESRDVDQRDESAV